MLLLHGSHFLSSLHAKCSSPLVPGSAHICLFSARGIHAGDELTIFYTCPKVISRRIPIVTCGCSACCSKPERRFLKFEPGDIGMVCYPSTSQVMEVRKRFLSAIAGVRPRWVVSHIHEGTYDASLLNTYVQGSLSFTTALEVPVSKSMD